jgi:hypothetical protein
MTRLAAFVCSDLAMIDQRAAINAFGEPRLHGGRVGSARSSVGGIVQGHRLDGIPQIREPHAVDTPTRVRDPG